MKNFLHLWNFNEVFNSQNVMNELFPSEHTKIHLGLSRRKPDFVAWEQQNADQHSPVHAPSLISSFVTCTLKGIIPKHFNILSSLCR